MAIDAFFHFVNALVQLLLLDLLLSGDNAVVIALACRSLAPRQMRSAMLIGTGGAMILRIAMATSLGLLLNVPLLKFAGGVALVGIAIKLLLVEGEDRGDEMAARDAVPSATDLWPAVGTIVVADIVMSLDNVVGLAAVAKGDLFLLALGLLISMPLLMFGSLLVTSLLRRYPFLVRAGSAMLGWIGGDIAVSDPMWADWVNQQSPALTVVVPPLMAVFVLWESRVIEQRRPGLSALRRARRRGKSSPAVRWAPLSVGSHFAVRAAHAVVVTAKDAVVSASTGSAPSAVAMPSNPPAVDPIATDAGEPRSAAVVTRKSWFLNPLRSRWTPVAAAVVLLAAGLDLVTRISLPQPAQLHRYDCTGTDATVYFRHGEARFRLATGAAFASGAIQQDNQIVWGDYQAAAMALGIAPPTHIRRDDEQSLVIDGGGFARVECTRHVGK